MSQATMAQEAADLIDVTGMSLKELLTTDNPVLAASMRRVTEEDDDSNGIVAGFQSAI